jgi:hypothetical protein
MYNYWAYGLTIQSEIEFPEFLPYEFEKTDLSIRVGVVPDMLVGEDVVQKVNVSMSPNEYLLRFLNIANYYAANGNEVIIQPLPGADLKSVRLFVLSNVMAAILHQRDLVSLHASGIIHNDELVLFCGKSGAGKSTLVTALQQKGYKIFTDDVCVLKQSVDGRVYGESSYPMTKLWQDSFERLGLPMAEPGLMIRPEMPKYALFFHEKFEITGKVVKQIFVLDSDKHQDELKVYPLSSMGAFAELQQNTYRLGQINAMKKRNRHFKTISALTQYTEVYKSIRPKNENSLASLIAAIESRLT